MYQKKMSKEVAESLTQVERIIAHLENGYELLEDDHAYFDQISMAFRIIFAAETQQKARQKIVAVIGKQPNLKKLIDDTVAVFGDFFLVNKNAMRVIQEKRHMYIHNKAIASDDLATAEKALVAIDKLYYLYDKEDKLPASSRKLPIVKRSSDPHVLQLQKNGTD